MEFSRKKKSPTEDFEVAVEIIPSTKKGLPPHFSMPGIFNTLKAGEKVLRPYVSGFNTINRLGRWANQAYNAYRPWSSKKGSNRFQNARKYKKGNRRPLSSNRAPRSNRRTNLTTSVLGEQSAIAPSISVVPVGIAPRVLTSMKAYGSFTLGDGTADFASAAIRLNDIFDPFGANGTIQPRGYDQYVSLGYLVYAVRACAYKLCMIPNAASAEASGTMTIGSYITTQSNAPNNVRTCIELPGTTGTSWDLGYQCCSNTSVTAAQLAPYERKGYIRCTKELARAQYGLAVTANELFHSITASPGSSNSIWLVGFIGQPDDSATDVCSVNFNIELTMYVELLRPNAPGASDGS